MSTTSLLPPRANVAVVGGGLAGLSAAIEAYRAGAHVTLLEKEKSTGGNSAKATSGINAVATPAQLKRQIADTVDVFSQDTLKSGAGRSNDLLVRVLTANSLEAHAFLESFGITLDALSQCGGHTFPRTHRESPRPDGKPTPVGWDTVRALRTYLDSISSDAITAATAINHTEEGASRDILQQSTTGEHTTPGSVRIITEAHVDELIYENDRVCGLKYTHQGHSQEYRGDAVVLATGGFSADKELLTKYAPQVLSTPTTNGAWAKGEGVKMAEKLGAALVDMDQVQLHPTAFIDPNNVSNPTKFLAPEALRGHGGILLSQKDGRRFTNELGTRDAVTCDILAKSRFPDHDQSAEAGRLPRAGAFMVLNEESVKLFDPAVIGFYISRGFFKKVQGVVELAHVLREGFAGMKADEISAFELRDDFNAYNAAAEEGKADAFGKKVFPVRLRTEVELYLCGITPAIHYTMGGIQINAAAEALRPYDDPLSLSLKGEPVMGLFAAGEVSGGVHGANRLAGNSLLECVVFGRIAGQRAAAVTKHISQPALSPDAFTPLRLRSWTPQGQFVRLFRFDLPCTNHMIGLKVGEYVAVRTELDGKPIVRYYSPISRPDNPGHVDLLLKIDEAGGAMTKHIASLRPGIDMLEFKGPLGRTFPKLAIENPKKSKFKRIALIAGGVGISPMIQIIRSVLHHQRDDLQIKLLYGSVAESELVFKDVLLEKSQEHPNLQVYFTVDQPSSTWPIGPQFGRGYMTAEVLKRELPTPGEDLRIIICGPYKMCQVIKKILPEIGYPEGMWYSFM